MPKFQCYFEDGEDDLRLTVYVAEGRVIHAMYGQLRAHIHGQDAVKILENFEDRQEMTRADWLCALSEYWSL